MLTFWLSYGEEKFFNCEEKFSNCEEKFFPIVKKNFPTVKKTMTTLVVHTGCLIIEINIIKTKFWITAIFSYSTTTENQVKAFEQSLVAKLRLNFHV